MLDQNKIWCGTRYGPHEYDSGDKKTKKSGKIVVKCVVKLKNCRIGTKIGVVVDMDPMIIIVVTKRQKDKKKAKKKKNKKYKKYKKTKKTKRQKKKNNNKKNTKKSK